MGKDTVTGKVWRMSDDEEVLSKDYSRNRILGIVNTVMRFICRGGYVNETLSERACTWCLSVRAGAGGKLREFVSAGLLLIADVPWSFSFDNVC